MFGATASYIILIIILYFAVIQGKILVQRKKPLVVGYSMYRDLNEQPPFSPAELGFSFAVGLDVPLTPDYGYFTITTVQKFANGTDSHG